MIFISASCHLAREGLPLFPSGFPQRNFALLENKTFSKGLIALKYKRLRTKAKRKTELLATADTLFHRQHA